MESKQIEQRFDKLEELIISSVEGLAVSVKKGFDHVDERFKQVNRRFDALESQVESIEKTVNNIEKVVKNQGKRITSLENEVF